MKVIHMMRARVWTNINNTPPQTLFFQFQFKLQVRERDQYICNVSVREHVFSFGGNREASSIVGVVDSASIAVVVRLDMYISVAANVWCSGGLLSHEFSDDVALEQAV
jgi:hypothetical protein